MKKYRFYIFYLISYIICDGEGAKILGIFPAPLKSHFNFNHVILKSLIEAGHEVTVITPFPEQASEANYTSIIDTSHGEKILVGQTTITTFFDETVKSHLNFVFDLKKSYCSKIMNLPEIQRIFKSGEKLYDVVFIEIFHIHHCFFPIAEKMKVPIIGTISFKSWIYSDRAAGNPNHPAYIPMEYGKSWNPESFAWRLYNVWNFITAEWHRNFVIKSFIRKFHLENVELLGHSENIFYGEPAIIFYNSHPTFFPRPMNPNIIEIGGIHIKEAKPLPQDIKEFIDEAEHGVILFSFGSVIRFALSPTEIINAFKEAFAEIPQRVIWKFEDQLENIPSNVMLVKWLPQRDILEHENVKAIISHCGQGGVYEAIYSATPIISVPLFGDQSNTASILENLGVSIRLDIRSISKRNVLKALNDIIYDTSYYKNMRELSTRFKDRPMSPQQTVVYWTEYVIRHNGTSYLKPAASQLNWFQYLLLDVAGFIVFLFAATIWVLRYVTKILSSYLCKFIEKISNNFKNKQM